MSKRFNIASKIGFIFCMLLLVYALALYYQNQLASDLWLWPRTPPLGKAFVGAWIAGGLIPLIWSGIGQSAPLRSLSLAGIIATGCSAILLFNKHQITGNERYLPFSILLLLAFLVTIYVFIKSKHGSVLGDNAVSPAIRWAFLLFSFLLVGFGTALLFDTQHIFPIQLSTDMAAMYGCFFLGSSAYFFYGFLRPTRFRTVGPMLSFLTYDILLIPPYFKYTVDVPAAFQTSLVIYLSVLISSALFCGYFLIFDPRTRMFK